MRRFLDYKEWFMENTLYCFEDFIEINNQL